MTDLHETSKRTTPLEQTLLVRGTPCFFSFCNNVRKKLRLKEIMRYIVLILKLITLLKFTCLKSTDVFKVKNKNTRKTSLTSVVKNWSVFPVMSSDFQQKTNQNTEIKCFQ